MACANANTHFCCVPLWSSFICNRSGAIVDTATWRTSVIPSGCHAVTVMVPDSCCTAPVPRPVLVHMEQTLTLPLMNPSLTGTMGLSGWPLESGTASQVETSAPAAAADGVRGEGQGELAEVQHPERKVASTAALPAAVPATPLPAPPLAPLPLLSASHQRARMLAALSSAAHSAMPVTYGPSYMANADHEVVTQLHIVLEIMHRSAHFGNAGRLTWFSEMSSYRCSYSS
jgi:hypothetical protein